MQQTIFKKFFEWLEGEIARGRRVVLFSIIFSYILMTFIVLAMCSFGKGSNLESFFEFYVSFGLLAVTPVIGFYTMTSPKRSNIKTGEVDYADSKNSGETPAKG